MTMRVVRPPHLAETVCFLDGISGTGKTMMAPVLGSFARMEVGKFNYLYEFLCALDWLEKIAPDAAEVLVRMHTDIDLYHLAVSREVNVRPKDLSSIFQNPGTLRYLRRLFQRDGVAAEERMRRERPILHCITHHALPVMDLVFRALGTRARVVEMVRHPYYLLEHWYSYIDRYGTDARDFHIWYADGTQALPWFARGWEARYRAAAPLDRAIFAIAWLTDRMDDAARALAQHRDRILFIPFEHFVRDPAPYLAAIERLLETARTPRTSRVLRAQRVPRDLVAAGPAKAIYKRYRWTKPQRGASEEDVLAKKRAFAEQHASPEALDVLDHLASVYLQRYGSWF